MPPLTVRPYSDLVRKLLAIKSGDALLESGDLLLPVIVLESERPEWLYLKGQMRFSSGNQATAIPAGGLFSAIELRNPVGSGMIYTIEHVYGLPIFQGGVTVSYNLGLDAGALGGGVGKGIVLDSRGIALGSILPVQSSAELRITAAAAAIVVTDSTAIDFNGQGATAEEDWEFIAAPGLVLTPGHRLTMANRTAAVASAGIFIWRERPAEQTELPV